MTLAKVEFTFDKLKSVDVDVNDVEVEQKENPKENYWWNIIELKICKKIVDKIVRRIDARN